MVRDVLNHGVYIGGRVVSAGSVPEAPPTLGTEGLSIVATLPSGITITPPFILCVVELEGGVEPMADIHAYAYFPEGTSLSSPWQRVRTAVANGDALTYVPLPTLGCSRFHVVVATVEGSPTNVRMMFRGVSKEAIDLLHLIETEFRPVTGKGGKLAIGVGTAGRIGPLQLDRAYHFFCTDIAFANRGDGAVVATDTDFPLQGGMVYEHTPRRSSQQYISFFADTADIVVYWGQAT